MAKDKKKKFHESEEAQITHSMIALKDFEICFNEYHKLIKKGDDISDVPEMFHQNLLTEGVI